MSYEVAIIYGGSKLDIQGEIREADPSVGIFNESFDITEMKCKDVHVHNDYDQDDYCEIIKLCLKEAKKEASSQK